MARRAAEKDWDDDEFAAEDSFDDDSFADDSLDDEPTVPCPYCNRAIHEDAPRCPYCENYISAEDSPPTRKSWFIILGAIVTLILMYWWIMH
jgi:hypothetical protein